MLVSSAASSSTNESLSILGSRLSRQLLRDSEDVEKFSKTEALTTVRGDSDISANAEENAASYLAHSIARDRGILTLLRIAARRESLQVSALAALPASRRSDH